MPDRAEAQPGLRALLRFHRGSWYAILTLVAVVTALAVGWPELAAAEWRAVFAGGNWARDMDWLLFSLGLFFLACVALSPSFDDLAVVVAGMFGGAIIEVWGTRAGLWYYYTGERPPLWILPAWGISALSNEKLQRALLALTPADWKEEIIGGRVGGRKTRAAYFLLVSFLFLFFLWWSRPALFHPYTFLVAGLIFIALQGGRFPAYALSLFVSGAALGVFLEIWGTTRHCWNYYDGKTPSPFPITGHGLAALAFWKLKLVILNFTGKISRKPV